jgi:hypothetical protein
LASAPASIGEVGAADRERTADKDSEKQAHVALPPQVLVRSGVGHEGGAIVFWERAAGTRTRGVVSRPMHAGHDDRRAL